MKGVGKGKKKGERRRKKCGKDGVGGIKGEWGDRTSNGRRIQGVTKGDRKRRRGIWKEGKEKRER